MELSTSKPSKGEIGAHTLLTLTVPRNSWTDVTRGRSAPSSRLESEGMNSGLRSKLQLGASYSVCCPEPHSVLRAQRPHPRTLLFSFFYILLAGSVLRAPLI